MAQLPLAGYRHLVRSHPDVGIRLQRVIVVWKAGLHCQLVLLYHVPQNSADSAAFHYRLPGFAVVQFPAWQSLAPPERQA
jgi:hypothetical protein